MGDFFFILCGPLRIQNAYFRATINQKASWNIDHNFYSPGGTSEPICIKSNTFYFKSMDMLYKAKLYVFSKRVKESERVPFRKNFLFLTHSSLQQKQISKKNPNRISVAVRKYILLTRYFILFLNVQTKGIQTIGPQKNGQKGISIAIMYLSDAAKIPQYQGKPFHKLSQTHSHKE